MKIARLELRAFGPFTDVTLDFDAGQFGLHVVYGANEAGKSSTLRALKQLLYGIPQRTGDDFLHPYGNLRIAGVLRNGDGSFLECVRRKATRNDLRAADDNTPLEPAALAYYLGGVDCELFETMFGIDHAALVQGGRDIVEGKGSLGQVLFAAGAGIADLKGIHGQLEKDAGELFKSGAKNPRINSKLSQWEAARKATSAAQLSTAEWERHDKLLRQSRQELAEVEAGLEAARTEKGRCERVLQSVALVAKLKEASARKAELGPATLLPEGFSERRREAVTQLTAADSEARVVRQAIEELDAQIEQLGAPEPLLAQRHAIEPLSDALGGYRKAQRDLPGLVASRQQLLADAAARLRQLRPELSLEYVERLRLSKRQQIEIQNLGNRHEALVSQLRQSRAGVESLAEKAEATSARLAAIETARDAEALKSVLRRAQSVARIEEELASAQNELARLAEQSAAALARLPLWSGPLEQLQKLPIPSSETIDAYELRLAEADGGVGCVTEQIEQSKARQAACEEKIEQVRLSGEVPTETDLAESRARRDRLWERIRRDWRNEPQDPAPDAEVFASAAELAAAFELAVRRADELADRLRREAERVAAQAALLAQQQSLRQELDRLADARRGAVEQQQRTRDEWRQQWRPAGIEPNSPREMRGWQRHQQALVVQAEAIAKQHAAVAALQTRIDRCRSELEPALASLGEPPRINGESLAAQLERGQTLADRITAAADLRARLADELGTLQRQLETERHNAAAAENELSAWSQRWAAAIEPLGLSTEATPAQAHEVLAQVDDLFAKLATADGFRERIEGIARESKQFEEQVSSLAELLERREELGAVSPDVAAERLLAAYRQATTHQARIDALRKQRDKQAAQAEQSRQTGAAARAVLDALCQEANCERYERLPEIERQSALAKELDNDERRANETLRLLSAGAPLAEFIDEVSRADGDLLPARIEQLGEQIEQLSARGKELSGIVTLEQKALADMDTSAAAAEAEERAQSLAAEIAADVEEYARLRLATAVLREAIERYRAKHQGPVLERASRLFAQLTVGSFSGLHADYNDRGDAVLMGLRAADGRAVGVEGMSEGTADQLYLALRLASLDTWLEDKEPIPLIVDDILIKFDNDRSAATLRVLGELSCRTQVIFFTHHEHLVELARQNVDADVLFVHELNARLPADILAAGPRLAR